MRNLLVLPTYQESANIVEVLEQVKAVERQLDVLVVDDSSPDGTADLAERKGAELGGISVLRRPGKQGLGTAYREGFRWGLERGYDAVLEMDADFSHDPADIPRLLSEIRDGADLVIGSRYVPGGRIPAWSWYRRALSLGGNRYARWMLQIPVSDATSGFRAYRADILARIGLDRRMAEGYGFQIEMVRRVVRAGGTVVEIPISFADRTRGESKMSGWIVAEALGRVTLWGVQDRMVHRPQRSSGIEGPGGLTRSQWPAARLAGADG